MGKLSHKETKILKFRIFCKNLDSKYFRLSGPKRTIATTQLHCL